MALSAQKRAVEPLQAEEARARRVLKARRLRASDKPPARWKVLMGAFVALAAVAGVAALVHFTAHNEAAVEVNARVVAPLEADALTSLNASAATPEVVVAAAAPVPARAEAAASQAPEADGAALNAGEVSFEACDLTADLSAEQAAAAITGGGGACGGR